MRPQLREGEHQQPIVRSVLAAVAAAVLSLIRQAGAGTTRPAPAAAAARRTAQANA